MAGGTDKKKKELMMGLIVLAVVLVLMLVIVLQGSSVLPPIFPQRTEATQSTGPTLVPNPYSAGDFSYRNGYLHCLTGQSLPGIDVSAHQMTIDWPVVAQEGIRFAMVRVGYRGWGNGQIMADEMAQQNLQGAADAGLYVGAYFYSQAISPEEAREEAYFVLDQLQGRTLHLPVAFDWEIFNENGRTANVDAATLKACILAFCEIIEDAGYRPMIYFNLDISKRLMDLVDLQQRGYPFWLAMYTDTMTYAHRVDMWQYSESGKVHGIEGPVDLNLYFIYE